MFTDDDLRQALAECYVPALRRDVLAAGLVRSFGLTLDREAPGAGIAGVPDRYVAKITLYAASTDAAMTVQMTAAVENRLLGLQAISRVELEIRPALFPILNG